MPEKFDPQRWFDKIQETWAPFAQTRFVIPFCTPIFERPSAVVVGKNHSDFVKGGGKESDLIAAEFANGLPKINTFLDHNHKFASGLKTICKRASIEIDETWIGTNRCAVQTGPDGIIEIERNRHFFDCQDKMDGILCELFAEIVPRNVILTGEYAAALYYPDAGRTPISLLRPRDITFPNTDSTTRVIPIHHPSRATYWQPAAETLSKYFIRDDRSSKEL
ncbi:MAG: hypothetical protein SGJ20_09295 [Planctomycetota bacterium]|nr:hypothetical protein [Planctomycetota bacterium]